LDVLCFQVEKSEEWIASSLVRPLSASALREVAGGYNTSGSMFAYFQHDLGVALAAARAAALADAESSAAAAVAAGAGAAAAVAAGVGAAGAGAAEAAAVRSLRSLCAAPLRERWPATVERHATLLDQWAASVRPLAVPKLTVLALYAPQGRPPGAATAAAADAAAAGWPQASSSRAEYEDCAFAPAVCRPENDLYAELG
jgi:hypothetical protein